MATPTGTIGMSDVNVQIGFAWNTNIWLDHGSVRTLAGAGGSLTYIDMNMLRGKPNFSVVGHGDDGFEMAIGGAYTTTVTCWPYVSVTGGSGNFTYTWTRYSGGGSFTQTTSSQCRISATSKSNYYSSGSLKCVVYDTTTGQTLVADNIPYSLEIRDGQIE